MFFVLQLIVHLVYSFVLEFLTLKLLLFMVNREKLSWAAGDIFVDVAFIVGPVNNKHLGKD